jgi:hypothetical protein
MTGIPDRSRRVIVFVPEGADVAVELGELGREVRQREVSPAGPPPAPPSGRPIWDDPNVLQFTTGDELRAFGAGALLEKMGPDVDVVGVVLLEPELRYEDAAPLLEEAANQGVQVAFAVGFRASPSAGG